ncbi:MAG: hypothetical protein E6G32_03070 [Actinobacteria bacterium]|nr:MAG: hypothetical protein E6G32_03070 [Actinomycetota bacterium]
MNRARAPIAVAVAAAAVLAGCGAPSRRAAPPQPKLPRALAQQLAARSDDVARKLAASDDCGALTSAQQLQQETITAINQRRVPPALQEPLSGAANDLVRRIQCTAPPKDHGKGKEKGKGNGKHGGEGD